MRRKYATEEGKVQHNAYTKWVKKHPGVSKDHYLQHVYKRNKYSVMTIDGKRKADAWRRVVAKSIMQIVDGVVKLNLVPTEERLCRCCKLWIEHSLMVSNKANFICKACDNDRMAEWGRAFANSDNPIDQEACRVAANTSNQKGSTSDRVEKIEAWKAHVETFGHVSALTGIPFRLDDEDYKPSPDRIVPAVKGGKYMRDNIRWVLRAENRMLREYSDEFFDKVCRARVAKLDAEQPGSSTQHAEA